jgi:CRISPR/Cas system-associated endoribonuclease Cas2
MAKTLTMRLDDKTYETFVRAAQAERRSLANLVETAALRHIQESLFVDDAEMAEILSRPGLVKRLKAGSRDAQKRRGRFVPVV